MVSKPWISVGKQSPFIAYRLHISDNEPYEPYIYRAKFRALHPRSPRSGHSLIFFVWCCKHELISSGVSSAQQTARRTKAVQRNRRHMALIEVELARLVSLKKCCDSWHSSQGSKSPYIRDGHPTFKLGIHRAKQCAEILRVETLKIFHTFSYFPVFDHFKMGNLRQNTSDENQVGQCATKS